MTVSRLLVLLTVITTLLQSATIYSQASVRARNSGSISPHDISCSDASFVGVPVTANCGYSIANPAGGSTTYSGAAYAESNYGRLRASSSATRSNGYSVVDNDLPDLHEAEGYAGFADTFDFIGLPSDAVVRFVFSVDGFNSVTGTGFARGDLTVSIPNGPTLLDYSSPLGPVSTILTTEPIALGDHLGQALKSAGITAILQAMTAATGFGTSVNGSATSDFSQTVQLEFISVTVQGTPIPAGTLRGSSGTLYGLNSPIAPIPEPATFAFGLGSLAVLVVRRLVCTRH